MSSYIFIDHRPSTIISAVNLDREQKTMTGPWLENLFYNRNIDEPERLQRFLYSFTKIIYDVNI